MQGTTDVEPTIADPPTPSERGHATGALVGAVSALSAVGFGVLADRLIELARPDTASTHGAPQWFVSSVGGLGIDDPAVMLVVAALAVVGIGALAGAIGGGRNGPVVLAAVVCTAYAVAAVVGTGSPAVQLAAPIVAFFAGTATRTILLRYTDPGRSGGPRARHQAAAARDQECVDVHREGVIRRRALVTGALVAVAAGASGLVGRSQALGAVAVAAPPPVVTTRRIDPAPALGQGTVVDVREFGAVGDGRTNDADAIRRGLAAVPAGGSLFLPAGRYVYQAAEPLRPGPGVTLAGVPRRSTIDFVSGRDGDFQALFSVSSSDVRIDGLVLRRSGDFTALLIDLGAVAGFTISRTTLAGRMGRFPRTCHGIKIGGDSRAPTTDFRIVDSVIDGAEYGLFQTNDSTAVITDIVVEHCAFTRNRNSDLEFNSPNGTTQRVTVRNSVFSDNDSDDGFGVGLAHVEGATIAENMFDGYALEAVHIEDHSADVVVRDNRFSACGLRDHSHVQVIGGSRSVQVVDNMFLAPMNTARIYVVNVLPGSTEPTVGGRAPLGPSDVLVARNTFDCAEPATPVYFQEVERGVITDNVITGHSGLDAENAFRFVDDRGTQVAGNRINGTGG